MYLLITAAAGYLFFLLRNYIKAANKVAALSHVPHPPIDSILQGHVPTLNKAKITHTFLDLFVEWTAEFGDTFLLLFGAQVVFFTTNVTMLKEISGDIEKYQKMKKLPNRQIDGQKIVGYDSILTAKGLTWASKRKSLSQFFSKTNTATLFDKSKAVLEGPLRGIWRAAAGTGNKVDLHDLMGITFAGAMRAYGLQDFATPQKISQWTYDILEGIQIKQISGLKYLKLFENKSNPTAELVKSVRADIKQVVERKLEEFKPGRDKPAGDNLLEHLIVANRTTGKKARSIDKLEEIVIDDIMTVILVTDNLTKQLCTLFMFISADDQERMFTELREVDVNCARDLGKLQFTEQCILEAMRMGPALLRGTRQLGGPTGKMETEFNGYKVPTKMCKVVFSQYVQHMNPLYWPSPETFNPDRWAPGNPPPTQFSYIPFWAGPRTCLGKHVAMLLMKLTLSMVARNFEVRQDFEKGKNWPRINQNIAPLKLLGRVDCVVTPRES